LLALDVELEIWLELEARLLLSELDTLEELRNDELNDELTLEELLNATLEELTTITTTELFELESKLLLELLDELTDGSTEEMAAELFDEDVLATAEPLTVLDERRDDCNELLLDVTPALLEELEVPSPPPQAVNNISTAGNRMKWILSNLRMDRLTTQIVIKRLSSNNGL
jgi:hypothetical protein